MRNGRCEKRQEKCEMRKEKRYMKKYKNYESGRKEKSDMRQEELKEELVFVDCLFVLKNGTETALLPRLINIDTVCVFNLAHIVKVYVKFSMDGKSLAKV